MSELNLMKLQNGSDVRGIAIEGVEGEHVNLTDKAANLIGQAFVLWLEKKCGKKANELKIGIGRDARITGEKLALAAAEGISSTGAKVVNCGLATTPAMFMSIVFDQTKFDGSLMITASHLPFNRNGIKFFNVDGGLEHEDIEEILKTAQNLTPQKNSSPFAENFDLLSIYAEHLKQTICKEQD